MKTCHECKKILDFENEPVWETADGIVCDSCFELYTDYAGQLDIPVKLKKKE